MTRELAEIEDRATKVFLTKPYWARKYETAPEGAKEYYRLMFANSVGGLAKGDGDFDIGSMDEERDRIYTTMDNESWDYILRNAAHAEALGLKIVRDHMQGKTGMKFGYWRKDKNECKNSKDQKDLTVAEGNTAGWFRRRGRAHP